MSFIFILLVFVWIMAEGIYNCVYILPNFNSSLFMQLYSTMTANEYKCFKYTVCQALPDFPDYSCDFS